MKKLFISVFMVFLFFSSVQAQENENKSRIGLYLGTYLPTGDVGQDDLKVDFANGGNFGLEYTYAINSKFRIGGYLEGFAFSSDTLTSYDGTDYLEETGNVSTTIIGIIAHFNSPLGNSKVNFIGGGRLGLAYNELEYEAKYRGFTLTLDDTVTTYALSIESGILYKWDSWDLGATVRYTYIPPIEAEFNYSGATLSLDAELSGFSILLNVGYNF
jgi:hypothetical protein